LALRQPGFVSSEANQTCGQGWSWIVLAHRLSAYYIQ
jgi:hypothetical protein